MVVGEFYNGRRRPSAAKSLNVLGKRAALLNLSRKWAASSDQSLSENLTARRAWETGPPANASADKPLNILWKRRAPLNLFSEMGGELRSIAVGKSYS